MFFTERLIEISKRISAFQNQVCPDKYCNNDCGYFFESGCLHPFNPASLDENKLND